MGRPTRLGGQRSSAARPASHRRRVPRHRLVAASRWEGFGFLARTARKPATSRSTSSAGPTSRWRRSL